MRFELSLFALAPLIAAQEGCNSEKLTAPSATESVPVAVATRTLSAGETSPGIHLSVSSGALVIRVTRQSMCGNIVTAAIDRQPGKIALVSHVSSDPVADCSAIPSTWVVDYTVTVGGLISRAYRVNVFEGVGDNTPTFLGSASISL